MKRLGSFWLCCQPYYCLRDDETNFLWERKTNADFATKKDFEKVAVLGFVGVRFGIHKYNLRLLIKGRSLFLCTWAMSDPICLRASHLSTQYRSDLHLPEECSTESEAMSIIIREGSQSMIRYRSTDDDKWGSRWSTDWISYFLNLGRLHNCPCTTNINLSLLQNKQNNILISMKSDWFMRIIATQD